MAGGNEQTGHTDLQALTWRAFTKAITRRGSLTI